MARTNRSPSIGSHRVVFRLSFATKKSSPRRVVCAVAVFWILCAILAPFNLAYIRSIKVRTVLSVLPIFLFFLIGINAWFSDYKITRVVRQHHVQINDQAREFHHVQEPVPCRDRTPRLGKCRDTWNLWKLSPTFAGAFVLCYLPLARFLSLLQFSAEVAIPKHAISSILIVAECVVYINSFMNPVIYFWRVTNLRQVAVHQLNKLRKSNMVCVQSLQNDNMPTLQMLQFKHRKGLWGIDGDASNLCEIKTKCLDSYKSAFTRTMRR